MSLKQVLERPDNVALTVGFCVSSSCMTPALKSGLLDVFGTCRKETVENQVPRAGVMLFHRENRPRDDKIIQESLSKLLGKL